MARYSNMSIFEANSKAMEDHFETQKREIFCKQYKYYKSIEAWNYPENSYERHCYEDFINSVDYKNYVEKEVL